MRPAGRYSTGKMGNFFVSYLQMLRRVHATINDDNDDDDDDDDGKMQLSP
jgi:hypothetical protein